MSIAQFRNAYHRQLCERILSLRDGIPNIADSSSKASMAIAAAIVSHIPHIPSSRLPSGQTAGTLFEQITKDFLEQSFQLFSHLRPGKWLFSVHRSISEFDQYEHLAHLQSILQENPELAAALGGDYLITPDIIIGRYPVSDSEINDLKPVITETDPFCRYAPLREMNRVDQRLILHASISCKWTIRSDRVQNTRTEGLNLIRNRKGHTPHIAVVTAEPLPTRLASLALGTGDLDCVYHFALPELQEAVTEVGNEDQSEVLSGMVSGRRLRDISDLPLDLSI